MTELSSKLKIGVNNVIKKPKKGFFNYLEKERGATEPSFICN